jgi:hypothetical protein
VRLVRTSTALRDEYDAVIARHPALADRLTQLRAEVAAHVVALAGPAPSPSSSPSPPSSPSPSSPPSGSASAAAATAPDEPAAALKALATSERRTSDSHTTALADAEPELARLLASVAAAGAAHAYLLTKGDGR